ncbi:MAG: diguanylate cyclase, partial [Bacilli bacterium]|nr:diguanylate cyclase [Bacilli bacterium]
MKLFRNPFILVIIFFLYSFLTLSFFFFSASSEIRIIQNDKLQLELAETSLQVEHNFHEIESRLTTLEYFIQSSVDDAKLLDLFIKVDENYQPIESLYFGKPDKTMINSTGFIPGPGFDLTTRLWYQLAIQSDDIIFTPAFINATNDRVIVTLAKAVYLEDTLLGVIASDVDIRTITAFVGDKKIGNTGFAFLFDINNSLLAYPNIDTSTIELKNISVYEPNLANLNSNSEFFFDFTIQGIIGVLSTKLIADGNYRLGVFLPIEEYSKGLDTLKWVFAGLSVMISLVGVFVLLVYYNRVNKPLNHLIKDIQSIDISSSFSYRLPEPMKDDYLSIRQAVNNLLETNDFYFSERQKVLHKLTLENQRVFLLMQSAADIIFEIDLNLRFVSVFGRGLATLKMKSSDFLGKTVMDVFGANGKSRELAYRKALEGIHNVYDWSIVVDNEVKYFEASISPMYDENKDIIGAVGITRDVTEYTYRQKEIEYLSTHDFLSGLYNRRHFVEMMAKLDQPQNYPIGMMMIDLNGLKIFNDAYGHIIGDKALLEVANVLKALVKSNEIVFRIGGDEFAVLFVNCSFEYLQSFKEKVLNSLLSKSVENISLSVAIGFDIKIDESHNFEEVMKNAENQMYRNKVT